MLTSCCPHPVPQNTQRSSKKGACHVWDGTWSMFAVQCPCCQACAGHWPGGALAAVPQPFALTVRAQRERLPETLPKTSATLVCLLVQVCAGHGLGGAAATTSGEAPHIHAYAHAAAGAGAGGAHARARRAPRRRLRARAARPAAGRDGRCSHHPGVPHGNPRAWFCCYLGTRMTGLGFWACGCALCRWLSVVF